MKTGKDKKNKLNFSFIMRVMRESSNIQDFINCVIERRLPSSYDTYPTGERVDGDRSRVQIVSVLPKELMDRYFEELRFLEFMRNSMK